MVFFVVSSLFKQFFSRKSLFEKAERQVYQLRQDSLYGQLFKNFGLGIGTEAEDPVKLSIRSLLFILLAYFSRDTVDRILDRRNTV